MPPEQLVFDGWEDYLVELVRHKSFVHSGAFFSRDEQTCRAICIDLLLGISRRTIALRYGMSRNLVNRVREIMEQRGELEPLKQEIVRRLNRCVIYSLENMEQITEENGLPPACQSIALGVLLDKKAALEGAPTARIEHVTTRKVSHDELNAWLDSLPSANPKILSENGPIDGPSTGVESQHAAPQHDTDSEHD